MNNYSGALFGFIMVFVYNFLDAGKEVYSGFLVQSAHPMMVTCIVFSAVLVFFQLFCLLKQRKEYLHPWSTWKPLVALNVTTAGSWITFFYCLKYLEPASASAIITGVAPLLMVMIVPFFFSTEKREYRLLLLTGIACSSLWLGIISLQEGRNTYNLSINEVAIGIVLSVACALFSIFSNILSKKLSENACRPESIMAHRFYLTVIVTLLFTLQRQDMHSDMQNLFPGVLLLALLGLIIPLWCLQYGIKSLPPSRVMVLISVSPVFTFGFQIFDPRLSPTASSFVAILLICLFSLAAEVWRIQHSGRVNDGYHRVSEDRNG